MSDNSATNAPAAVPEKAPGGLKTSGGSTDAITAQQPSSVSAEAGVRG